MKPLHIYIIAGEPSGDALGAGLMRALRLQHPEIKFTGIGGEAMQAQGLSSFFPYEELSLMGFVEIVPHIPALLKRIGQTAQHINMLQPNAVITIDSPGFTFRLAKKLKELEGTQKIRRIHYVAPSVWAYKPQRAAKTADLFNMLMTLLAFEPPYFIKEGLKTICVGHPVLWQHWQGNVPAFRAKHGIAADAKLLLILPGSRRGEVKKHLPVFLESAHALADYTPVILAGTAVKDMVREMTPEGTIIADFAEKKDAFAAASLALSKSGTVTLELAAAGVPMVVAHKVNAISAWLIRRMILIKYASLVNIAVNEEIVPEYIQERCNAQTLGEALQNLTNPAAAELQRTNCKRAIAVMRGNQSLPPNETAATSVLDFINVD